MPVKFDIILPTYQNYSLAQNCYDSICGNSRSFRIILINDTPEGMVNSSIPLGIHALHPIVTGGIGFTKSVNAGLALSTAPYVVLMNSDTEVMTENWLEKLAVGFDKDLKLAAIGPATDRPQQGLAGTLPKDTGLHYVEPEMTSSGILDVKLWFWCIMIRREAILDVGYLDERFSPGGGEDDDWLIRAYARGWKAAIQTDVTVKHIGQASWPQLEPLEQRGSRAHRLLRQKYGDAIQQFAGDAQ